MSNISSVKRAALALLHLRRKAATKGAIEGALARMEAGRPLKLAPGFAWTIVNLAIESERSVSAVRAIDRTTGLRQFASVLERFEKLRESSGKAHDDASRKREHLEAERSRRKSAETSDNLKSKELTTVVERCLELRKQLSSLEKVRDNFGQTVLENQQLRAENSTLKFRVFELEAVLYGKLPQSPHPISLKS